MGSNRLQQKKVWQHLSQVIAGIFLSVKLVEKWARKPMFVSFDTVPTQIWDVPFPAVTVCNVLEANRDMVIDPTMELLS